MVSFPVPVKPVAAPAVTGGNGPVPIHSPQLPGALNAPPVRTLVEIFEATVAAHPDSSALDDGRVCLSYAELQAEVKAYAGRLRRSGIGVGDRVGVRIPSGTNELYVAILAVLFIGAAYVPVDADDPDERARLVFAEAGVSAVLGAGGIQDGLKSGASRPPGEPGAEPRSASPDDDAWIIFTSGSTGTPKGVAVTHRAAAAFVDAEARLFLQEEPLGPSDRVLAGLSVAFDASCEEMWLAWRHGACLVPAPRALVRTGMDLGPWLVTKGITAVSTVPTLAALWPVETLDAVRLLIFGGESCPPELVARLAVQEREVWNTYGPTEATVVSCAALMDGSDPVRIGLPLDGWDLAVVDSQGIPVPEGNVGELIIGGVGLARYLDPAKDAEKFAPMESLGWSRAYRSGDLVRFEREGLLFMGRADEQVKLGGRRIELGEVDSALQALPGIHGAAAAVKNTGAGHQVLVGYLAPGPGVEPDLSAFRDLLARTLPAALVPMLTVVGSLPVKTSGKVDRAALPWPLISPGEESTGSASLDPVAAWIAEQWTAVLGTAPEGLEADFFAHGGGSLAAAQLVSALRTRYPTIAVADIYSRPRLGALVELVLASGDEAAAFPARERTVRPTALKSQIFQVLISAPLHVLVGMRWLTYLMAANNLLSMLGLLTAATTVSWWWVFASWAVFVSPLGRMALAAAAARILLRGVVPGAYPRSGKVHLRLWLAEQIADLTGAVSLAGAPWIPYYARALGAKIGPNVDLHSVPPVTGMLYLGPEASVEPEVDLSGWWIDGDLVHIGRIHVGRGATIGSRSTLMPGARVGAGAEVAPGSAVLGKVRANQHYAGSPAVRRGKARPSFPAEPARTGGSRLWFPAYAAGSTLLAAIPLCSVVAAAAVVAWAVRGQGSLVQAWPIVLGAVPLAAAVWFITNLLLTAGLVRILGIGLKEGHYRVRSLTGWRIWATERVLDAARDLLFPIYASLFTPVWLRMLGAKVGRNVEASTVLLLPSMTTVGDGAFLADDTMIASYELAGGWMKVAPAKIGKRAFLGNSGMTGPGRSVPKNSLVAVLSATPAKAKSGTSWLGSPPVRLRRSKLDADQTLTFDPPLRLKLFRACWELCRAIPVFLTVGIAAGVLLALDLLAGSTGGYITAALLGGVIIVAAGAVAAAASVVAKWLLVGRIKAGEHPLWSSFIWRNEVVDTFVEMVTAPWFARSATGSPALVWWLRALGARIGSGSWCESYWLPEADLVTLGENSTVNRGCVIQTHLFHDRVMSMAEVTLDDGATIGPHGVILPAARIGAGGTVGPASLVMRGETVPAGSYWIGNPVSPWSGGPS
ncbi:amino acid adenylation domain-containing protein [Arthrobacter sp. CDRTa11]|uniref:Pls/PosA family non-ribosomal peptide synthetase n=1 Tax=Arthrobacter sp. CDRTa11 TaxID=2651199 RepID=UPI002265A5B3|nr:Pls/PosA family non-ribosomal peptide synthetase [Arthrobacter sp. CDRTa11]UZX04671.1 amino acid adenylation domain-containing protein [Arthrobacter sp. CDRTa11]